MIEFAAIFVLSYIWHMLGVTVGYHRLLSHRAFTCSKPVEYFWILAGYLAFEGSPIWWATNHRAHHRFVDTERDPHSPRFGVKHAHSGWIRRGHYGEEAGPEDLSKDLLRDPLYRFLDQGGSWRKAHTLAMVLGLAFRVLILCFFGWIPALASVAAGFVVLQIPLILNVICHLPKHGYKTYALKDDSVNVWWLGLLAMGEGWHNNHHAAAGSARTGMRPWEIDVSWMVISLMKSLRIIRRVSACTHEQLLERQKRAQLVPEMDKAA